jgi:hypothetical protein
MITAALVLSCVPMFLAFLVPNWYLGDVQNAVDETDMGDGEALLDGEEGRDEEEN